jgi:hypothetical protein
MNRLTRCIAASGAGLALALTASPALAAPLSNLHSNPAHVEHVESSFPDGSSSEFHGTTRFIENENYTTNTRDQSTAVGQDGQVSSFDDKTHYMLSPKVLKMNSQYTFTESGMTCRTNSRSVMTNEVTRTQKSSSNCQ